MSARREQARISAIYLQRRVGDFIDNDQPVPRWTNLDQEAVANLLREFRNLDLSYRLAVDTLREHDLAPELPTDWDLEAFDESWFVEPQTESTSRSWWKFWQPS